MKVLVTNATIVDGTGAPPIEGGALVIEDFCITEVVDRPAVAYDRSDLVIDAHGAVVVPGIINHHAHGLTRGPLMIIGEPPLSDARVLYNLHRHLAGGTTTALNVDGYPAVEDAVAVNKLQPVSVRVATLHTPKHLEWALHGPFPMGGIEDRHRSTVAEMISRGAVAIGEAGPGIDGHWADYTLIPLAVRRATGHVLDAAGARRLRVATDERDRDALLAALAELLGETERFLPAWREITEQIEAWGAMASNALDEAIDSAVELDRPLVFHHTPTTFPRLVAAAERLGDRLIAAHSNFQCTTVEDTLDRARTLKALGAHIDVMGGDSFGVRMFHPEPTHLFALVEAGLVDAISTDYCGGYWDPLLRVGVEAWRAGLTTLPDAVRMLTSSPAAMVPGLAPQRGILAPGMVADIVITEPGDPAAVRSVLVSGRPVHIGHGSDDHGTGPSWLCC